MESVVLNDEVVDLNVDLMGMGKLKALIFH